MVKLLMKRYSNQPVNHSFLSNSLLTSFHIWGEAFRRPQHHHLGTLPGYVTDGLLFVGSVR